MELASNGYVVAVFTLVFIVLFPTFTALVINRITSRSQWLFETYEKVRAGQILHERLISGMCGTIGVSRLMAVVTTAAAFISAVQGFSYLYSRKKIDFYMGMPIKRKRRFLNIWLNGILLYVIPYLTGLLISILIAAQNNAVDKTVIFFFIYVFIIWQFWQLCLPEILSLLDLVFWYFACMSM